MNFIHNNVKLLFFMYDFKIFVAAQAYPDKIIKK